MRYSFGAYSFDPARYALAHVGMPVPLRPMGCELLAYLLTQRKRRPSLSGHWRRWRGNDFGAQSRLVVLHKARRHVSDSRTGSYGVQGACR
jgi:DNA-binding response OmpR family regulator